jgi:hypothetical protein
MNNWKAINTAPKDRRILMACPNGDILVGECFHGTWFVYTADDSDEFHYINNPIAWQELPEFDRDIIK